MQRRFNLPLALAISVIGGGGEPEAIVAGFPPFPIHQQLLDVESLAEAYDRVGLLIELLQSKARLSLVDRT